MKKFVKSLLFITSLFVLVIMGYNYSVDEYGLFHGDYSKPKADIPERFVKMRFLLQHPDQYNSFCFGSSRIASIDLTRIRNGKKYYNMTYAAGIPSEWLHDIKQLLAGGVVINQIIIGVDNVSFLLDPIENEKNPLRRPYYNYDWKMYTMFLLQRPVIFSTDNRKFRYDIYNTGRIFQDIAEKKIAANPEGYAENLPLFISPTSRNRISDAIDEIKAIKTFTDQHGIELIVFINPMSKAAYLDMDFNQFNDFKCRLANVVSYYDFSGLNEIAVDNHNYYDTVHYRPVVGDKIIDRVFGMEESPPPRGFGVWVTKDNVEEHIRDLENELNSY